MRSYEIKPNLQGKLSKLAKKDNLAYERVIKKIKEICDSEDAEHYKNLRKPLQHLKRVHVREKVLVFRYDKNSNHLSFEDFDHHDKIYK
jgi:mRNA-degrading endonuclease RelE of RelBE toxin-antitoxin system